MEKFTRSKPRRQKASNSGQERPPDGGAVCEDLAGDPGDSWTVPADIMRNAFSSESRKEPYVKCPGAGKRESKLGNWWYKPEDSTHRVLVWLLEVGIGRPYRLYMYRKEKL